MKRKNAEFKEVKGIGRIPVDWEVRELSEIAKITMGQSPSSESYNDEGIGLPLIQGNADCENRKTKPRAWTSEITKTCEIGDIIMTVRAPAGSISKSFHRGCIGRGVCAITYKYNPNYLYHYLVKSELYWDKLAQGTTFTAINSSDVNTFKIGMPSNIKEQEKIAQILSNVDMNIEKTKQAICKYKQVKKGLMDDLLTGEVRIKDGKRFRETRFKDVKGVGKIPWDWEVKELCGICNYVGRGKSPEYKEKSEYKVINQACIYWEGIKDSSMKYVTKDFFESLSKDKKVIKGDILINSTGTGTLGRVIYYDRCEDITYDSHVTKVSIKKGYPPYYAYYFSTDKFQSIIETFCVTGSTNQIELQKSELEKRYVPVFNEKEQIAIAEVLKHQDTLIKKENENLEKLKKLKLGLMVDLLTGKVRVKVD